MATPSFSTQLQTKWCFVETKLTFVKCVWNLAAPSRVSGGVFSMYYIHFALFLCTGAACSSGDKLMIAGLGLAACAWGLWVWGVVFGNSRLVSTKCLVLIILVGLH